MNAFTNMHAHAAVFGHLWRSLHDTESYSNGWVPYRYESNIYWVKPNNIFPERSCLLKTIPSCYKTPFPNCNDLIRKFQSLLCYKDKLEKRKKRIYFDDWFFDLLLIYLATKYFSWELLRGWNFVTIIRKK